MKDNIKWQRNFAIVIALLQIVIVALCVVDVINHERSVTRLVIDCVIAVFLTALCVNRIIKACQKAS